MNVIELIARFHPLLVHLPIGILVLDLIIMVASYFKKWENLKLILSFVLFWGALGAIASCVTGYLLSLNGDYNADILSSHQWSGIGLAVAATLAWAIEKYIKQKPAWVNKLVGGVLLTLLVLAGHHGGSLTHGANFLTEGIFTEKKAFPSVPKISDSLSYIMPQTPKIFTLPENKRDSASKASPKTVPSLVTLKPVESQKKKSVEATSTTFVNVKPIYVYQDLIQPILEKRCYSCHGATKVKGGLRLDSPDFILKGGDNGASIIPGDPDNSYMYGSLVLPIDDDYHMPPEGKPQLTPEQIQRIHWWILKGGSFEKNAQEMAVGDILPDFIALPKQDTIK